MVKENLINLIENKKPVELVQELKNDTPSFEEFMKTYEVDEKVIDSYRDEIDYVDVWVPKGSGPCKKGSCNCSCSANECICNFSISYSFEHGVDNEKYFFEESGRYSNSWKISGSVRDLQNEHQKLRNGVIRVVKLVSGYYERDRRQEREIEGSLLEDMAKFIEMEYKGRVEYNGIGREFSIPKPNVIN